MREVKALQRRQHGLVTRRQALAAGVTRHQVARMTAAGEWERRQRAVYADAAVAVSYDQVVLAAVLACHGPAWASHRTAARLWKLSVPPPELVDVLTGERQRLSATGVAHHFSREIRPADVTVRQGVPVTTVARTLMDCIPFLGERGYATAVDDARRRRLLTVRDASDAHRWLDRGPRTGRHKVVPARRPLQLRLEGQLAGGSALEIDLLDVLRKFDLPLPLQQVPIRLPSGRRVADFAYPDRKIVLEVDGFEGHGTIRSTFDDGHDRNNDLALAGWLVLHFTSAMPEALIAERVSSALRLRAA